MGARNTVTQRVRVKYGWLILRYAQDDRVRLWSCFLSEVYGRRHYGIMPLLGTCKQRHQALRVEWRARTELRQRLPEGAEWHAVILVRV